jgi:signal transduction histidine kinase/DNA-binding response OmpR family regulator/ligand-binding sensor domain-containing protein
VSVFVGLFGKRRFRFTHFALAGLFALQLASAQPQHSYTRFTTNDGLAQGMVVAIHLDSRGYLWCGTKNGLSRYDGYTFRNFQHDPSDNSSISGTYITAIHECPSGDLWIGFVDGKIDIFDRQRERFKHLDPTSIFSPSDKRLDILNLVEDLQGRHWYIAPGKGIMEVDRLPDSEHPSYTLHQQLDQDLIHLNLSNLPQLFVDRIRGLMLHSSHGTVILNGNSAHQINFPRPSDFARVDSSAWNWVMYQDSSGLMWLTTVNILVAFNPTDNTVRSYTLKRPTLATGIVYYPLTINEDHQGNILLLTSQGFLRVNKLDPNLQEFIGMPEVLKNARTYFLSGMVDNSGAVWFGTPGYGLFRYDGRADRFGFIPDLHWNSAVNKAVQEIGFPPRIDPTSLSSAYANLYWSNVMKDQHGKLWTQQGIYTFQDIILLDPATGNRRVLNPWAVPWPQSNEWFGAASGLWLCALEDNAGDLWVGKMALRKFDRQRGEFRFFQLQGNGVNANMDSTNTETASIVSAMKDHDGTFWFGTISHGLYHFNPTTFAVQHYVSSSGDTSSLSHDHVLSIREDPLERDRYLWVGTDGGGLNRLEKQTGKFQRITQKQGLSDNVVYSILTDKRGHLWMSTNQGICRMDPRSLSFRNFDVSDGLKVMEFNREEYYQDDEGTMYFGNVGGINIFRPEDLKDNMHIPPVVLTDLKLRNVSVQIGDSGSILSEAISETKEIKIPYEQNVITLEYAALDFLNPGKNQYSHMLEGFEKEWSPTSTNRTATYTNLAPGEYIFKVRGSNCDGAWNMNGASLTIVILPPWYRSAWAYATYAFLLVGGLFLFRRYDLKRIRLKDQLDLEQVRSAQLREVDQLKMRFFQNVSHEFRTPLTLILGPIEKLLENLQDQSHKRELRLVRRNAQRLLGLINQILDVSKLDAGGMKLQASQADIVPFVRGIAMAFHSLAERKGIFLDVQADVPSLLVYFDQDKLEKVLVNLLGNSFKFTPESGEIIVRLSLTEHETLIAVRDTGIGIPKDRLPHIFDRFYQVDSSTTRSAEGTGIGLSLVKDFVDLHHGRVNVTSEPGRGTEFTIYLQLGSAHLTKSEIAEEALQVHPTDTVAIDADEGAADTALEQQVDEQGKPIILVVEDNADVREYIRSCLTDTYAISEAKDGLEGIEVAEKLIPDLVISDVMMPNMDGYDFCAHIKREEKTSHIPVILLTAKAAMEDRIGGLETVADDYLIKPFDTNELLVRVKNLIELRRKLREKFGKELVALKPDEVKVTPVEKIFIQKVIDAIEEQLSDESFSVERLAEKVNMSYTQLHRKLKAVTDQSAAQFIRTLRLKKAMELLQNGGGTVSEIAYSVGFGSPAYFTKCFQEEFGRAPSEVRKMS